MRVARVEYEGQTRTAIVSPSGDSVRLLPPGSTPIEALSTEQPSTDTPLAHMAWSFEELVAYASRGTWVQPGDVLGSGTCGFGCLLELWGRFGRDLHPPLKPGDTVELNVQGIGTLTNRVTAGVKPVPLPTARRVNYITER
jgi:2-keto-4-pentenoate hydratase/2-oxohepta-3-ene-1,7-dioic acid hydratase in catechol pathway